MVASSSVRSLAAGIVHAFFDSNKAVGLRGVLACPLPMDLLPINLALSAGSGRRGLGLSSVAGTVELVQQIPESVGDPLSNDIIVDSLQDIAEPSLIFAAKASSGFS
jgi:hypothetical protein